MKKRHMLALVGFFALAVGFTACGPSSASIASRTEAANKTMEVLVTQIYGQAEQTRAMAPTDTPTITNTPTITDTPTKIPTVALNPSATSQPSDTPGGPTSNEPPTPTLDRTSILTRTLVGKCIDAFYVGDIGPIFDNTEVKAGKQFTKTWEVRNIGQCTWNRHFKLVFYYDQHMNGPNFVYFPEIVPPNNNTWLSVTLTAPDSAGIHTGQWYMQDDTGKRFGVCTNPKACGAADDAPLMVKIKVVL
jgi:hypothetical protein